MRKNEAVREKSGPQSAQETRVKLIFFGERKDGRRTLREEKRKEAERDETKEE